MTLKLFFLVVKEFTVDWVGKIWRSPITRFVIIPAIILYSIFNQIEGSHQFYLSEMEFFVEYFIWWFGLGVLSSVGLGTGMHTGVLFLFPHIFKVCLAASQWESLAFSSRNDIWFRRDQFVLLEEEDPIEVTFLGVFLKVLWPCFFWGAGTALGEVPPYWVSRAAALAGEENSQFVEATESKSQWNVVNRMKDWMISFLQKHGFVGVLLMAAWPNMAFDLCGICCGHFLMPFWQFLGATFIGKALIKSLSQACFFIMLFTPSHLESFVGFVESVIPDVLDPCVYLRSTECHILLHRILKSAGRDFKNRIDGESDLGEADTLKIIWGWVMFLFIGYFVISCIEQFAQQKFIQIQTAHQKKIQQNIKKKQK